MEELYSTEGDYGLRALSEPDKADVDIVFVHGLTGNRETTWTHKKSKTFWPQSLLAGDLPTARIFTFGYGADILGVLNIAGANTVRDHGNRLTSVLALRRMRTQSNQRPLIFVAHSLGGLVVEQALLVARGAAQQHLKDILESTAAIAFMGTPHLGSNKADWGMPMTRFSSLLRKTNREIVKILKPGSKVLADLQRDFHTMLDDRLKNQQKKMEIFCFYEELPMDIIGKIVSDESAILSAYPNSSIRANHTEMVRFSSVKDDGYIAVSGQLWLWTDALQQAARAKEKATVRSSPASSDNNTFEMMRDANSQMIGSVTSNGGPIFLGNNNAGRNFNVNTIFR